MIYKDKLNNETYLSETHTQFGCDIRGSISCLGQIPTYQPSLVLAVTYTKMEKREITNVFM